MDSTNKKSVKKTNVKQFQKLVDLMELYPQIATGCPVFGSHRVAVEDTWDNAAKEINALGPPVRSGSEWKRVWHDLKCRLKKKISENNKSIYGLGGGPYAVSYLTQIELQIDRICNLSSETAPIGSVEVNEITPPNRIAKIAVVTPTSTKQETLCETAEEEELLNAFTTNMTEDHTTTATTEQPHRTHLPLEQRPTVSNTPLKIKRAYKQNLKRKSTENHSQSLKLLREQIDIQAKTITIMKKQAEAANMQAKAAKVQAEAAKAQAEAAKDQAQSLKEICNATKTQVEVLNKILKHFKGDD